MHNRLVFLTLGPVALVLACNGVSAHADEPAKPQFTAQQLEFFERDVKPILKANCLACHGAERKVQSQFYLTSREGVLKGGEIGLAVSLDKPDESALAAIRYEDLEMPPKGKLPQAQIDILTRWVKLGLPWPEGDKGILVQHGPPVVDEAARNFWSFRPVVRPPVPNVKDQAWVRTALDAFVLAKLEEKGLQPAPPAEKAALLRRASYSVTGLPPSPEEVAAFLADNSADAYEKVVDRLLESRHYGEHWGRHWLDLVRYAESNSFERDNPKPFVWRYRDYVIDSLNADKPYDVFLREQLAGDELDSVTPETLIATGYYRLGLWDDEPADPLLAYYDGLDDILGTTGQTFLGLTVNGARCHDHKIDPFPQRDYYKLLAFFHGIRHFDNGDGSLRSISSGEDQSREREAIEQHRAKVAKLQEQIGAIEEQLRPHLVGGEIDDFKFETNRLSIFRKHTPEHVSEEDFERYQKLRREAGRLQRNMPRSGQKALAVTEDHLRDTHVLLRGNPHNHGDRVEAGFPLVLTAVGTPSPSIRKPSDAKTSGGRRVLADWIASPQNPLTSRVLVNRLFQYHFGRGIVRSSSNFGYMGTPPTHPELLDWLASELVEPTIGVGEHKPEAPAKQSALPQGPNSVPWSLKRLHRLILLSSAFRMSGQIAPAAAKVDPENDLLSHFDLRRLGAEEVRDSILAACGNLNLSKESGPSIYPVIPAEVLAGQSKPGNGWEKSTPEEAAARSVFVHIKRSLAVPILAVFDSPDPDAPCPVRFTTTQPTQALGMLNSQFLNSQAGLFAKAARERAGDDPAKQVAFVLRRALQRTPTSGEIDRGLAFIAEARTADSASAEEALRQFCLLALNLNEFVYLE